MQSEPVAQYTGGAAAEESRVLVKQPPAMLQSHLFKISTPMRACLEIANLAVEKVSLARDIAFFTQMCGGAREHAHRAHFEIAEQDWTAVVQPPVEKNVKRRSRPRFGRGIGQGVYGVVSGDSSSGTFRQNRWSVGN